MRTGKPPPKTKLDPEVFVIGADLRREADYCLKDSDTVIKNMLTFPVKIQRL